MDVYKPRSRMSLRCQRKTCTGDAWLLTMTVYPHPEDAEKLKTETMLWCPNCRKRNYKFGEVSKAYFVDTILKNYYLAKE